MPSHGLKRIPTHHLAWSVGLSHKLRKNRRRYCRGVNNGLYATLHYWEIEYMENYNCLLILSLARRR
jgi:hypothetical protein